MDTKRGKMYLDADAGLCNRLRALSSAYFYCLERNIKLTVIWNLYNGLNAKFCELFDMDSFENVDFIYTMKFNKIINTYDLVRYYCTKKCRSYIDISSYKEILDNSNTFFVSSYSHFYQVSNQFSIFKPKQEILGKASLLVQDDNTIGLHIRRTDNKDSIENSPLELFVSKIKEEIKKNESIKFYLSTDDKITKTLLLNEFGERIITNKEATLNRNTKSGIIDACIDLYSLSRTKKIYGSYWSSFSEVASYIGNTELEILTKNEKTNG